MDSCPASLKQIAHFLKCAREHDTRDAVVAYWCRMHAVQTGMKLTTRQPEETAFLIDIMDKLETMKKEQLGNDAVTNEVVAQAHMENYALKLFSHADQNDRAQNFGKTVVKSFYTAGVLYDVLLVFGELSEEAQKNGRYAKWRAAYIHNCLKNGETPVPGTLDNGEEDGANAAGFSDGDQNNAQQPSEADDRAPIGFTPNPETFDASMFPSPPADPEEKNPGGFQPYVPPPVASQPQTPTDVVQPWSAPPPPPAGSVRLTPDQLAKAQKYCKWAGSALTYEDINSAIENMQKGLHLLQFGRELA